MGFTYAGEVQFGWQRFYSWTQKGNFIILTYRLAYSLFILR